MLCVLIVMVVVVVVVVRVMGMGMRLMVKVKVKIEQDRECLKTLGKSNEYYYFTTTYFACSAVLPTLSYTTLFNTLLPYHPPFISSLSSTHYCHLQRHNANWPSTFRGKAKHSPSMAG